jgi:hypothetical protein
MDTDEYMANPRIEPRLILTNEAQVPPITFRATYTSLYEIFTSISEVAQLDFKIERGQVLLKNRQ